MIHEIRSAKDCIEFDSKDREKEAITNHLMNEVILDALVEDQTLLEAYENMLKNSREKQLLVGMRNSLKYGSHTVRQGKWVK